MLVYFDDTALSEDFWEGKGRTFHNGVCDCLFVYLLFRSQLLFHKALGLKKAPEAKTKSVQQSWIQGMCWVSERFIAHTCSDPQPHLNMFWCVPFHWIQILSLYCPQTSCHWSVGIWTFFVEKKGKKKLRVTLRYSYLFGAEPKYWKWQWKRTDVVGHMYADLPTY